MKQSRIRKLIRESIENSLVKIPKGCDKLESALRDMLIIPQ